MSRTKQTGFRFSHLSQKLRLRFLLVCLIAIPGICLWTYKDRNHKLNTSDMPDIQPREVNKATSNIFVHNIAGCRDIFLPECECFKRICQLNHSNLNASTILESTCNEGSTFLGEGQKVVSFSLFKSNLKHEPQAYQIPYHKGIPLNLLAMRELYPGWVMRLYSDLPTDKGSELCKLRCESSDFFYCNVTNLPNLGDIRQCFGMLWRFVPLGDPTVSAFLSRDLDSLLSKQEVKATRIWEESNKTFHFIRDHKDHKVPILGGTFGVKTSNIPLNDRQHLLRKLLDASSNPGKVYGADQVALAKIFYQPKYHRDSLAHDRFHCSRFPETQCIPFPRSNEEGDVFVGMRNPVVRL